MTRLPSRRAIDAVRRRAALVFLMAAILGLPRPAAALLSNGNAAIDILGQFTSVSNDTTPSYTTNCVNNGSSALGLNLESGNFTKVAIDATNHWLFAGDPLNERVLVYPLNGSNQLSSKTPSYVLGSSTFTSCYASSYNGNFVPAGLAVDPVNQRLFVSAGNAPVLVYNTASMSNGETPSYVLDAGSGANYSSYYGNHTTQSYGSGASGLALDVANQLLYVADQFDNRVMVFNVAPGSIATGENASYVLGQTSWTGNGTGTTQSTLSYPEGLAFDSVNQLLYVADESNNRVMVFPAYGNASWAGTGENALYELGQASFTISGENNNASGSWWICNSIGLFHPIDIVADPANNLVYVSDAINQRIMVFGTASLSNGEPATYVLGQPNFSTNTYWSLGLDNPGTSQSTLAWPQGMTLDTTNGLLYVSDADANRIMIFNVSSIPSVPTWSAPTQSGDDACALGTGALYCWGYNNYGEDGLGTTAETVPYPQQVGTDTTWTAISQGDPVADESACGIDNGKLYCWGRNTYGELGLGNTTQYTTPQQVGAVKLLQQATNNNSSVTFSSTTTAGSLIVVCDKNNGYTETGYSATDTAGNTYTLGVGPTVNANLNGASNPDSVGCLYAINKAATASDVITPVATPSNSGATIYAAEFSGIVSVSPLDVATGATGNSSTISSGSVTTTNANDAIFGFADGAGTITDGSGFTTVSSYGGDPDEYKTVTSTGSYSATFTGSSQQFIAVMMAFKTIPSTGWTAISSGGSDTCGINNGSLYCWGRNNRGEDGQGNTTEYTIPQKVGSATNWIAISQGGTDACGIQGSSGSGELYCWGYNHRGEVGNGGTTQATSPVAIGTSISTTGWTAVSQGYYDTCGIVSGKLYCWGYNHQGELGIGNTTEQNSPTQVGSATNWIAASIVYNNTNDGDACGIRGSSGTGALYCWGNNGQGEVGQGNTNTATYETPTQVGSATNWSGVSVGETDVCATAGGGLYCWGYNDFDEDGDGLTVQESTPQPVIFPGFSDENATDEIGQYVSQTSTATVNWAQNAPNNSGRGIGLWYPGAVVMDEINHYLYVQDTENNRVLVYALNTDNSFSTASGGHTASYVLGESSLTANSANSNNSHGNACTASDMNIIFGGSAGGVVGGLAFDSANNRLFVSDTGDGRVLVYNVAPGSLANGESASYALGESNLTTCNTFSLTQSTFGLVNGLAYDAVNSRLFAYDTGGARVLVFNVAPGSLANGENASYVLGQSGYTTNTTGATQSTLNPGVNGNLPGSNGVGQGIAYDPADNWLFVADQTNNRVMVFNVNPSIIANGENASYVLGQTTWTGNGAATTQSGLSAPQGLSYDHNSSRLFVGDNGNNRVMVFNVSSGTIANGENAAFELGETNFTANGGGLSQSHFNGPLYVYFDPATSHLFVSDYASNRIMIFEGSVNSTNAQHFFIQGYE